MNESSPRPTSVRPLSRRALLAAGIGSAALAMLPRDAWADSSGTGPRAKHVVLLAWDGFDPAYLDLVETPHLDELARQGSLGTTSGCFPSISNTSWATIATGAWPHTHLNTPYFIDPSSGRAVSQTRTLEAQSIAEAVTAAGGTVASVQFFIVQNHGTVYGDPRALYVQPGGPSSVRVDVAVDILHGRPVRSGSTMVTVEEPPMLLAVYCDALDGLGHQQGAEAPDMGATLAALDADLGRLVQATKDVGIYGETAFLVVGDHGMTTFTRGFGGLALAALSDAGFTPEFVSPGSAPSPQTDLAMVVGGVASVHLLGTARTDENIARARAALESVEQVQRVYDRADLDAFGASPLLGELVAEPVAGWSFAVTDPDGPRGYHGRTEERESALLLAGRGVRNGVQPQQVRHVDIAPTIAALLGIPAPAHTEGRVLTEALHHRITHER
ncbi:alkaline phosphatase family protein [Micromonospora sp. NPDC047548]|uniref:alkaline phosphatase family protein n=1 Tax=Micromonospora sp. NPDC047548 TaxID=3155624 RepID=UPI0033FBE489